MLKQTKKTKEIYEDIQRKIYYMIPDKWEKLYLYASFIDKENGKVTGELFFYYIPKGIFLLLYFYNQIYNQIFHLNNM